MRVALIVVLAVSAVLDLALGVWASVFWESFRQTWFFAPARTAGDEPQLLGLVLGLILIFVAALQFDAIRGIRREREGVFRIPIFFGGYLIVSSIVTFLAIQSWDSQVMPQGGLEFLVTDGLRGGFLVALGILAMRAPATVSALRLPKQAAVGTERAPERSRDREPWRKRGREGGGRNRSDRSGSRRGEGRRSVETSHQEPPPRQQQQPPRQQHRPSAPAEPARPSTPEAAKDRSLSVVVKGDFRSGTERVPGSTENGGNESTERDGRRRRRRRGGATQRSEGGSDSNESTNGAGMEGAHARADMTRAVGSELAQSNGSTKVHGTPPAHTNDPGSASRAVARRDDVVDLVDAFGGGLAQPKSSDSGFGRNRRSGDSRRR